MKKPRHLITGAAGFIGSHLMRALRARGDFVIGIDNFNDYYDPALKRARGADVILCDINERDRIDHLVKEHAINSIVHLAAQAGVRYSMENPSAYIDSNVTGFMHLLEVCKENNGVKFTFASSSSVYGDNTKVPFSESDRTDHPSNFYSATKKSGEMMAHAYHSMYGIPMTGLRYFTVYGPQGRPDMAYYLFTEKIAKGEPIQLYNGGEMARDFTYIDDIVRGTIAAIDKCSGYELYNLGNHKPEKTRTLVSLIEEMLDQEAIIEYHPKMRCEVDITFADISKSKRAFDFQPQTSLREGMEKFVEWYLTQERVAPLAGVK